MLFNLIMHISIVYLNKYSFYNLLIYFSVLCGSSWLLLSCSGNIDLPNFDETAWQQDVRSCQNIRPGLITGLKENIPKLKGLRHDQIIDLLGKPEGNSLELSGERIYSYFIQAGSQCGNKNAPSTVQKVFIRFDALDRVYKVRFDTSL
ncbi:MAG: hypothetical protein JWQ14_551 [Adhaeribacter sp.]|nr:hypothetical protein [Adhaeribacter sp.]